MKNSENFKRPRVVAALVAIVLAAAIGVEGYYLYRQSHEIERLTSELTGGSSLPPVAIPSGMSGVDPAAPVAAIEVSVGDMIVHDESDRYVVASTPRCRRGAAHRRGHRRRRAARRRRSERW